MNGVIARAPGFARGPRTFAGYVAGAMTGVARGPPVLNSAMASDVAGAPVPGAVRSAFRVDDRAVSGAPNVMSGAPYTVAGTARGARTMAGARGIACPFLKERPFIKGQFLSMAVIGPLPLAIPIYPIDRFPSFLF